MVGRPVDHERRLELLDAAVDYVVQHGFAGLSWRPISAALGVSTTTLVHHFGTKESLLDAILARLRERIVQATGELAGDTPDLQAAARAVWEWSSHPDQWPMFRLFFAVYGSALQAPDAYADFLSQVSTDWTATLVKSQGTKIDPQTAARQATLVIATLRGLLLDLLSSEDRDRVDDAADHFMSSLG